MMAAIVALEMTTLLLFQERIRCVFGSDSVTSRHEGPKESAAFQIVLKRRTHLVNSLRVSLTDHPICQFRIRFIRIQFFSHNAGG